MGNLSEFLESCCVWVDYLYDQKCEAMQAQRDAEVEMGDSLGWE